MKKNLIVALALVFVLGIAGTAFAAANPFVDVPAKHWAYDAVTKLAQAGILDGYGDGTYRGERLATRYELAQATAKAMARADKADAQMKGLIDKLAVEFAAELNNLGVRVAKLEKNASTIKFWGDSRMRYQSNFQGFTDESLTNSRFNQRIRVYAKADLNEKAAFYGRLMAEWTDRPGNLQNNQGTDVYWDFGYFEWTMDPAWKVAVGRQQIIAGQDMFWTNGGFDAIQFKFGAPSDKFKAKLGYGDVGTYNNYGTSNPPSVATIAKELALVDMTYQFSKDWSGNAAAYWATNADVYPFQVWTLGFTGKLGNDFTLRGAYFANAASLAQDAADALGVNPNGWYLDLWYKGANRAKVGSWGLNVNYRDVKTAAIDWGNVSGVFGNSMTSGLAITGVKGWGFQGNYTISKNAVLTATYETLTQNGGWMFNSKIAPFYYVQLNVNF